MPLFSPIQMGANSSRATLLQCILKNWHKFDLPNLKGSSELLLWYQMVLVSFGRQGTLACCRVTYYNTILQLDWFCRKQGKWVEVTYVLLFIFPQDIPDLCPKGADLVIKPLVAPCAITLHLCRGSQLNRLRIRLPFQEGLPQSWWKFKQYQLWLRLLRRSKKYIEAFTGLTWLYEFTWTNVMYVLGQTLTPDSRAKVLEEATTFGDEWLERETRGKRGHEIVLLPTVEPRSSHNRANFLDVFLKDSNEHMLRL